MCVCIWERGVMDRVVLEVRLELKWLGWDCYLPSVCFCAAPPLPCCEPNPSPLSLQFTPMPDGVAYVVSGQSGGRGPFGEVRYNNEDT